MIRSNDTLTDELLTRTDVARLLGVSPHTLACWRSAGKGPAVVKYGAGKSAAVRYRRSAVEAWIDNPPQAEAEAGEPWRAARRQAAAAVAAKTPTRAKTRPAARRRRSRA